MIAIALDKRTVEAGEFLTGTIQWTTESGKKVTRITAAAEWRTQGAGNVASGVGRSKEFTIPRGKSAASFPFRFLIPYEGPVSFDGELITMTWSLCARVDQTGFDETAEELFRVVPRKELTAC